VTPALLLPDSPEGRLIKQLPTIAQGIAQASGNALLKTGINLSSAGQPSYDLFAGSVERLTGLLMQGFAKYTLAEVQRLGIAGALEAIKKTPIFTWDDNATRETIAVHVAATGSLKTFPLPVIARRPGFYAIHPAFAMLYLGRAPNIEGQVDVMEANGSLCYPVYDADFGVLYSQGVIDAMRGSIANFVDQLEEGELIDTFAKSWYQFPEFFDDVYGTREVEVITEQGSYFETVPVVERVLKPEYAPATVYPWPCNALNHPGALIQPFAELGWRLRDARSKAKRAQRLQLVAIALAAWGGYAAITSIASSGFSLANVAQLTTSIDRLPGVDLGVIGDIAAGLSSGLKFSASIPGADTMFDFPDDLGEIVFDPSAFDVELTLDDIGANVVNFDDSIFYDFGLEATDLLSDDFGNIFTVTGEAVALDPEAYVKSIYIDEAGNYRDFSNNVLLSQAEADQVFNESGADNDAVFAELASRVQSIGGQTFGSIDGPQARPAGSPAPANQVQVPVIQQISDTVLGWFKTITSYQLAKEQLEKTGRYTPPYQTSPSGTAYSQVPGVPIRRTDGSMVVNNGNGTQTVQYPDGRVQTMPTNLSPASLSGGTLIPGLSNQTLLLAGAGLLAVVLLTRRN
jgi:hypothetical protein